MSLKTLNKWLVFIAVLFGVFFGVWASLEFILAIEEMRAYTIVFKFWSGIQKGSVFICALLAFVWFFTFFYSIIVAIREDGPTQRQRPQRIRRTRRTRNPQKHGNSRPRRPSRIRNHAANSHSPVILDIEEDDD